MNLHDRWPRWAAVLTLGLVGLIGGGAATVPAASGGSAATGFELTLLGEITLSSDGTLSSVGTFKSRAPFCAAGAFVDEDAIHWGFTRRRFTCDDGTGSLTARIAMREYYSYQGETTWTILEGSGNYANLRGGGSLQYQMLNDYGFAKWRSVFEGIVDRDAVAPRISVSRATATKLPGRAGVYRLKLRVALRDNVTSNPVSYTLRASAGGVELARRSGRTRTKVVPLTLHIRPRPGAPIVRLALEGADPVGNAASVRRTVRLPR